ncbi:cation:proton antiporter [Streptomyces sp. G44]|uniref:cation:proton antiporter n=1 Tax=Streptomyces sp. G44 TaxID=2807632 RepID=UPI001960D23F|nr:cation:proton antiporter [Streptomyces sp. G44]MBM7167694.1 cation:proton antiporter [Streptomyces sp. G44]
MDALASPPHLLHLTAAFFVVIAVARIGRGIAVRLRQPDVIGEIAAGLLVGPAVLFLVGRPTFDAMLPSAVFDHLKLIGEAGLILFLVGLAHHLRSDTVTTSRRATTWVSLGSLLPSLVCGILFAGFVTAFGSQADRGSAPLPAFILICAISLSISAVPVMARVLASRKMEKSPAGRLTLSSAIVIDAIGWLLLTTAICLSAGSTDGLLHIARALAFGVLSALAIRCTLRTAVVRELWGRTPRTMAVALAVVAISVALTVEHLGMTAILGAALVGLAVPPELSAPWGKAVTSVSRVGLLLVPAFFVVTGIKVFSGSLSAVPWSIVAAAIVLGVLGKGLGGYAGARLGGQSPHVARQVGVLMNTRGLTELIVLQAGFSAGLLSAPLVLALIVMALVTTAMTGPLLTCLERADKHVEVAPVPYRHSGVKPAVHSAP